MAEIGERGFQFFAAVFLPSDLFGAGEGFVEMAGAVVEQQLGDARVLEWQAVVGELFGWQGAQGGEVLFVGGAEKAVV